MSKKIKPYEVTLTFRDVEFDKALVETRKVESIAEVQKFLKDYIDALEELYK